MLSVKQKEALLLAAVLEDEERNRKKRKIWVHSINNTREQQGEFHTLYPDLRKDEKRFFIYFRMTFESFDELLNIIKEDITKECTNFREPISPIERLAVTLRFLATGDSYSTIGHSFRMGFSTVSAIVAEVCDVIWKRLQPIYMPEPNTQLWNNVVTGFKERWNFPNCVGSIDGKHVTIKCPNNTGSNHFCYMKKFSIVLMAIVDHDYKFICIDVGGYGKNSDGGIFETSAMGIKFATGTMGIPSDKILPGQNETTPCVLIGDEAFALSSYLMRPFPYRQTRTDTRKENYNNGLCTARRVVENAFGILAQKWRLFYRPLELKVDSTIKVVKATCVLHNYLRSKQSNQTYMYLLEPQEPTLGGFNNLPVDARRATNYAFQIRERFVDYFNM